MALGEVTTCVLVAVWEVITGVILLHHTNQQQFICE